MKRISFFAAAILSLLFFSCQKAIDWNLPGGSSGNTGKGVLIKTITKNGSDSIVVNFTYDGSKRLTRTQQSGNWGGTDATSDMKIYRNGSGVITRTTQSSPALVAAGVDSIQTTYNFNSAANRYTSSLFAVVFSGIPLVDSVNYFYDGSGNLIRAEHLQSVFAQPFVPAAKSEFTYSAAGNIASIKGYTFDFVNASYTLETTEDFTFDSKNVPLRLSQFKEGVVLFLYTFFNVNNPLSYTFTSVSDPASNYAETNTYTYTPNNRPLTGMTTEAGAVTSTTTYTYQ